MKKLTKEEFIEKARKVHGNKYDYSKVEYVNARTNVTIICPIHGEFPQTPSNHLSGRGCDKCGNNKMKLLFSSNTEEFITKARKIHGDKYDYSKVEYKGCDIPVTIICPIHGEFPQTPSNHLSGRGCDKCGNNKMKLLFSSNTEEFITKARKIHGDKYDYSKVEYKGCDIPVTIICPIHGEFPQTPSNHLSGRGCDKCGNNKMKLLFSSNTEEFITKARKIHGDKYDYSKVEYKGCDIPVTIICPIHGEFPQTPSVHLAGHCCNKCNLSHLENNVLMLLTKNHIKFETQKTFDWLKFKQPLRLDFYLPEYNIAIECQGVQHFYSVEIFGGIKSFKETCTRDKKKKELCEAHDIKILYYSTDEFPENDIYNKDNTFNSLDELIAEITRNTKILNC